MGGLSLGWLGLAPKKWNKAASNFITGTPAKRENVSTLRPDQEPLSTQAINAGLGEGAGGAFGDAADYYRSNLSDNPADFNAFAAPQLRQYNEDIVPGISEQFAGMGAGGLSSSGFQNAQIQGATDLSERLGAIRANLRHSSAQGLQNIGQSGLQPFSQNMETQAGSEGFLSNIAPAAGTAIGSFFGGPAGTAIGNWAGNKFGSAFGGSNVGKNSSPYGGSNAQASPRIQLPNFQTSMR